jgi:hypothetical protein
LNVQLATGEQVRLEVDLRNQHLTCEVQPGKVSNYGEKYEIVAPLVGPNGKKRLIRSVWMIRKKEAFARLITLSSPIECSMIRILLPFSVSPPFSVEIY